MIRLSSAALGCFLIAGSLSGSANAQALSGAAAATGDVCPAHVRAYALNGHADELAFGVWADDGMATTSGSIVAYVNGGRYEIPFTDAVIPDERDAKSAPTPIVVKFDAPVNFESAYVGSIEGTPCAIHSPFTQKPLTQSLANASTTPPMQAPAPEVAAKPTCATAYAEPAIVDAQPARTGQYFDGSVAVRVDLDANGKATALHLAKSDRAKSIDESAVVAAAQSTYTPQIFRCEPVSSSVAYNVSFVPVSNAPAMLRNAFPTPIGDTVKSSGYHYSK